MSSSAATPGPPPSSSSKGDSPPSPADSNPPPADQGKSAPPPSNSKDNSNSGTGNGNNDNNNNNNNNSSSSSPPPSPSSPPPSPPPPSNSGSGDGSGSGGDGGSGGGSPPSESPPAKASPPQSSPPPPSSPPPSSPPPASSSGSQSQKQSPPPQQSSPPPANSQKSPPPSTGSVGSPPPPSSPPNSPEASNNAPSNPTPSNNGTDAPGGAKWSPPPQTTSPPPPSSTPGEVITLPSVNSSLSTPGGNSPPAASGSPPSKLSPPLSSSSSPSNSSSQGKSPGSPNSSKSSNTPSGDSVNSGTIVGATVAGVFVIALIAIIFVVRRKRRRRDVYPTHYMPPQNNFPEKPDGYFYSQPYAAHSGPVDTYYGSQPQQSPMGTSYGSQRGGNGYGGSDSGVIGSTKSFFTYEEVMEITNGFSRESVIGEGGFGYVYKGKLQDGKEVAVKQLKAGSGQGEREFRAEVEIISRVHHRHLVSLVGYCISDHNRLLLYEFVPNKTLEHHLHGKGLPVLDWNKRVKIAIGAAKGLAYLHEDCHPKIIHRDIKSANILLDDVFEAQVADFGLARLNDTTQTHVSTRVMGTFGYLAPEYASSGKLTDRSDVYSFGVVLLELITGRKPVDASQPLGEESLVEWARPLLVHSLETGDITDLVDPRLEKHYVESEVFRMIESAAACVRHSAPKRPRMVQVVRALDSEGEMSDLSNGVKVGQSTVYDSGQYNQDIMMFRKMALGVGDSSEFSTGEYSSRDLSQAHSVAGKSQTNSSEFTSGESETRAMNQSGPQEQGRFGGRRL